MSYRVNYHFQNVCIRFCFRLLDQVLCYLIPKKEHQTLSDPRKILICNIAHMGDVVTTTSVIPVVQSNFPNAEIDFLIGSCSKPILAHHPGIRKIHLLDHWKLNRSPISFLRKWWKYRRMYKTALTSIKAESYDVALDVYYYYPNSIP